jgi:hypothetical protein
MPLPSVFLFSFIEVSRLIRGQRLFGSLITGSMPLFHGAMNGYVIDRVVIGIRAGCCCLDPVY